MTTLDLSPLEKACSALQCALMRAQAVPEDEELRDASTQRFEFTFELARKMTKRRSWLDLPSTDELEGASYRTLIRIAAQQGLVDEVSAWPVFRDKRNIPSRTYDDRKRMRSMRSIRALHAPQRPGACGCEHSGTGMLELKPAELEPIRSILRQRLPGRKVLAFGSRVTGLARRHSDLDLVVLDDELISDQTWAELRADFDDSNLPMRVDLSRWHDLPESFRREMRRQAILITD